MKRVLTIPSSRQTHIPNLSVIKMEKLIELNKDYCILICQVYSNAIRPGKSIKGHFRAHKIKGLLLRDIIHYYSTMDL